MAQRFFTADLHLGSSAAIELFPRKFRNVDIMSTALIQHINAVAKTKEDILIHIGDFCQYGNDKHYTVKHLQYGMDVHPRQWLNLINPSVVMIEGNHDNSNKVKCACRGLLLNLGCFSDVTVGHYPTNDSHSYGTFFSHYGRKVGIHLCGHVHGAWKWLYDEENNILNVNCGVDVWKYNPVSESKLCGFINSVLTKEKL